MQIDDILFKKLERLSQLNIADEKRELVKDKFTQMLSFIDILNGIDEQLSKVELINTQKTPFREDKSYKNTVIKEVFAHSPASDGDYFLVPKIIE